MLLYRILLLGLSLSSCYGSRETSGVWVNREAVKGNKYSRIFIYVASPDIKARRHMENVLAAEAGKRGFEWVKSLDAIPPDLREGYLPSKEKLNEAIRSASCDAAFEVTLLRKEETDRYVPGTVMYQPRMMPVWNGRLWGYYNYWRPTLISPGYYTTDKEYFIQSNLYDVPSEALILSVQSTIYNPVSLESFSRSYLRNVVNQLKHEGLIAN